MEEGRSPYREREPGGLKEYAERTVDLLQRRKWIIVSVAVLVMGLVAAYTYSQEPIYRASSLVLISSEDGTSTQNSAQYSPSDPFARGDRSLQNELVILRNSESLRRAVAERLMAQEQVPGTERLIDLLSMEDGTRRSVGEVAARLAARVQFETASRETDVLRIVAESTDPGEAALLSNLYMEEYLELTQEASRARLTASREFLEKQATRRENELEAVEKKIQAYESEEGAVALDQEGQYVVNRIAEVEASRDEARVELRMRKASLSSLEDELASISPEQLSQRVGSGLEEEVEALQSKIAELELSRKQLALEQDASVAADSMQMAQIDGRIERLREEMRELAETYVDEMMAVGGFSADEGVRRVKELKRQIARERIEITGLEARIDVLSERLEEYDAELRTIPEQTMELAQLERSRSYAERMYQFVVEQLQETRIQEESQIGYANSITRATVPTQPVSPDTRRNLMLGFMLGLLAGMGIALVRDRLDHRMYKPDQVRKQGYRLLGVVPNFTSAVKERLDGEEEVQRGNYRLASSLVANVISESAAAEAYRYVRTTLQFGRPDDAIETLLVTSPGAGDGKSVTAANLALVMAQAGHRTLLIDADLKRPCVHRLFGMQRAPGLTDLLEEEGEPTDRLHRIPIDGLQVLTAGQLVPNPAELLGTAPFRKLLRVVQREFDLVVIDSPPVLAATDAVLLSTQVDGTMLVARAGVTTHSELEYAMHMLDEVGASVLGTLFNGFDVSMAYGYKLRYRNYTRHGVYDRYQLPSGPSEGTD